MNGSQNHRFLMLRDRIQKEFQELPGLHLTQWQAARLWNLEPAECEAVLKGLVAARVLRESRDGYVAGEQCVAVGASDCITPPRRPVYTPSPASRG